MIDLKEISDSYWLTHPSASKCPFHSRAAVTHSNAILAGSADYLHVGKLVTDVHERDDGAQVLLDGHVERLVELQRRRGVEHHRHLPTEYSCCTGPDFRDTRELFVKSLWQVLRSSWVRQRLQFG